MDVVDDFPPDDVRMTQIGAYPGVSVHGDGKLQIEGLNISPKSQQVMLRRRGLV